MRLKLRFLVAFGLYAFLVLFFIPAQWSVSLFIDTILFNSFAFLAVMSHFKAMTSGKETSLSINLWPGFAKASIAYYDIIIT